MQHAHRGISLCVAALTAAILVFPARSVEAQLITTWTASTGGWSTASNWDNGEPTVTSSAYVANGGTATVTLTGETCNTLCLGGTGTGTVKMTNGTLTMTTANVGNTGIGIFTQSAGSNTISSNFCIANNVGASGTYSLSGGSLYGGNEYIGYSGNGTFTQSGGTNSSTYLFLGYNPGASGTYNLSGGSLSANYQYVGRSGNGVFTQSGGTNTIHWTLYVGSGVASSSYGTYTLTGSGVLVVNPSGQIRVGANGGTGRFEWFTDGLTTPTLTLSSNGTLAMGFDFDMGALTSGALFNGTTLNGLSSGTLEITNGATATHTNSSNVTVGSLIIGSGAGSGTYNQSGGSNTVSFVSLGSLGRYEMSGGGFQINGGLANAGTVDCAAAAVVINVSSNSIVDFSKGSIVNALTASCNVGAGSLVIVGTGFNPASAFGSYSNAGLTHTAGTTLVVPSGTGFSGWGSIDDPVDCQGTITAGAGGFIDLNNGLMLSGSGTVNLGYGDLRIDDATSGISSGSLFVSNHYVGKTGTGVFTQTAGTNNLAPSGTLCLGYSSGSSGTYNLDGGALTARTECVGYSGSGTFTQSAGTNNLPSSDLQHAGTLYLGYSSGSTGTYNLGGGALTASFEYVGYSGSGTFTQTAGTNNPSSDLQHPGPLYLGYSSSASGTYNLSGGYLRATFQYIGYSGTGTFTQSGGINAISNNLYLGNSAGATGTYNLSGSGRLSSPNEYVGYSGTGTFTQTGGTNTGTALDLGLSSGASGTYNLSGGYLGEGGSEYVGDSGSGTFTQSGGTNTIFSRNLYLGLFSGSSGTYNLSDGALSGSNEYVGNGGSGVFTQSGGTNTISSRLYLGSYPSSSGTYNLSNSGQLSVLSSEYVGYSGTGAFTQSGGTNSITGGYAGLGLCLGYNSGSSGTYNLSGGSLAAPAEYIGYSGTGAFTQSGGTNTISGDLLVAGTYNLSGGSLSVSGSGSEYVGGGISSVFTQSGGKNTISSNLYLGCGLSGGTYNLSGSGRLSAGSEWVGANSGSGVFTQSGGTNAISSNLYLGYISSGTYNLSNSGQLSALAEYVGSMRATGSFQQSGGLNTTSFLSIANSSRYRLTGGTIHLNGGFQNTGTLDGGGGAAVLTASNSIVDFSQGSIVNVASTSLSIIGANSLLIVTPTFNPGAFGSFSNAGLTHTTGTTLTVSAGQSIAGWGTIGDFVNCQGTITAATGGSINLSGGLMLSGSSSANLGYGALSVDNTSSGMSGTSLSAAALYVGNTGIGTFTQSGGTNTPSFLSVGFNSGANGTYNLSAGSLSGGYEYVGFSGSGVFTQSGGTNSASAVNLASGASVNGAYNLNGGLLLTGSLAKGAAGSAAFNLGGGTLQATGSFATNVPITAVSGNSTIDTNGFNVTISGNLAASGSLTKEGLGLLALGSSLSISNSSRLLINSGSMTAMSILGSNSTITVGIDVSSTAMLVVNYIHAHSLVLNPGSVVILGGVSAAAAAVDPGGNVASSYAVGSAGVGAATVPEPSTFALLGAGAIAMLAYAWRRRKRAA